MYCVMQKHDAHLAGGDASASFSQALTYTIEILIENNAFVIEGKK